MISAIRMVFANLGYYCTYSSQQCRQKIFIHAVLIKCTKFSSRYTKYTHYYGKGCQYDNYIYYENIMYEIICSEILWYSSLRL